MERPTDADWSIWFYIDERGESPVEAFLDSLDESAQVKFATLIEQLRSRNVSAREPLVKQLDGKLWELRERSRTNIYRVIYYFASGRRIVLLHGFQKKTQRTPRGEIELAERRLTRFIEREGGTGHGRRRGARPSR